jgi:hypothetical protein
METGSTLLLAFVPAGLLFIGMYLLVKSFLARQYEQKKLELGGKSLEITTPLRLQAYERMTLYLERITPNYLLLRLYEKSVEVSDFQVILLKEIREEYYHNLSQQIYISPETWDEIKNAMNEMLALVNQSATELKPDEPSIRLSKKLFDKVVNESIDPTGKALLMLKKEVQQLFT